MANPTVSKVSKEQALEILDRYFNYGERQQALAKRFCVSQPTISRVVTGKLYPGLA